MKFNENAFRAIDKTKNPSSRSSDHIIPAIARECADKNDCESKSITIKDLFAGFYYDGQTDAKHRTKNMNQ